MTPERLAHLRAERDAAEHGRALHAATAAAEHEHCVVAAAALGRHLAETVLTWHEIEALTARRAMLMRMDCWAQWPLGLSIESKTVHRVFAPHTRAELMALLDAVAEVGARVAAGG